LRDEYLKALEIKKHFEREHFHMEKSIEIDSERQIE
jgi:hypothetical protein